MIWMAGAIPLVLLALAAALWAGRRAFERKAGWHVGQVGGIDGPLQDKPLPRILRDYALHNGAERGAAIHYVEIGQSADIRLSRDGTWMHLWAWEWLGVRRTGFLWKAGQQLWGPFAKVLTVEGFCHGWGMRDLRPLGLFPTIHRYGADMDRTQGLRYLGDLPWVPDAILGNPDLHWRLVANDRVRVTMGDLEAEFTFDPAGDVIAMRSVARPTDAAPDGTAPRAWQVHYSEYRWIGGRRIPLRGEAGYLYPDGFEAFWRAEITACHIRR